MDPSQEIALYLFPCAKGNLPDPDRMLLVLRVKQALDPVSGSCLLHLSFGALESLRVVDKGVEAAPFAPGQRHSKNAGRKGKASLSCS